MFVILKMHRMSPETATYVGYAASVFIVLSFVLRDLKKIRIVNMIGCICFVVYWIFSGMLWPVIIPNGIICGVQAYHLLFPEKKS
jgi:hypothetical protein